MNDLNFNDLYTCRQLGAPTLFLTLSSSEYSWDDLLISILKTKKDLRDVKQMILEMKTDDIDGIPKADFLERDEHFIKAHSKEIVEEMTSSERNHFVNSNIVLTTIEFQNRIQHIFKVSSNIFLHKYDLPFFQLLKTRGFLDDENRYKLEDSFIRIEHQVLI